VVDDRLENRDVLGRMLSVIGCEVFSASGGDDALDLARAHQPAIIFIDLLLPGMSAAEITRELLANSIYGQPKIVAHTASPLARHRSEAFAAGCVDFIAKPFRCEQIYECLSRHLSVTFDYAEPDHAGEALPATELASISLPEELCARLMVGAELHSTTALKAALQDLRQLGPDACRLAEHIRQLMRSYDMDGVQRLLARVAVPGSFTPLASSHHGSSDQPRADA
jgi:CheY-like chemotaxis protein